ncbi:uncharacterized protein METZ01_LOCUS390260 [marine metagenome]|uniref:Uncharacterized protein n=1 Tax=marine metagenome TaxID=408172 RepID=A0A382UT24_9ZZZZ
MPFLARESISGWAFLNNSVASPAFFSSIALITFFTEVRILLLRAILFSLCLSFCLTLFLAELVFAIVFTYSLLVL